MGQSASRGEKKRHVRDCQGGLIKSGLIDLFAQDQQMLNVEQMRIQSCLISHDLGRGIGKRRTGSRQNFLKKKSRHRANMLLRNHPFLEKEEIDDYFSDL